MAIRPLLASVVLLLSAIPMLAQMPPTPTQLSSAMPPNVAAGPPPLGINPPFQRKVDIFAWQQFVAMNWPPAGAGQPGPGPIGQNGDNDTVWETYLSTGQVFQPGAKAPPPWGTPEPIPAFCPKPPTGLATQRLKLMSLIAKGDVQDEFFESFTSSPLFDVNGRYTRYEVRINQDEYKKIVQGGGQGPWYIPANQVAPIVLPAGDNLTGAIGAVEIKASWRQINASERGRYHSAYAYITYAPDPKTNLDTKCVGPQLMGMVGLHIAHKTTTFPQWAWATFEHVDNAPPPAPTSAKNFSYNNNPNCTLASGCANQQPPTIAGGYTGDPGKTYPPVQVVRAVPIPNAKNDPTTGINPPFQQLLRAVNPKSVWQYYELVDIQWPSQGGTVQNPTKCPDFTCGGTLGHQGPVPVPFQLANTTMETYFQNFPANKNASRGTCMGCHSIATVATGAPDATATTDFSFLFGDAQPPSGETRPPRVRRKKPSGH